MPLIELTAETRGDVPEGVHIKDVELVIGGSEPEFYLWPGDLGRWINNPDYGSVVSRSDLSIYAQYGIRFARRATPSEIAAQAPSVGRDELVEVRENVEKYRQIMYTLENRIDELRRALEQITSTDCGCHPVCQCDHEASLRVWKKTAISIAREALK